MQRTKASVSVQVKQVIASLCRLLAATGLESVPAPETFRRAKFGGGPEVEDQFWQLLANILQAAEVDSCEACAQQRGEQKKLVAAGLWQTGFHADWMFVREEGREAEEFGRCSSRELLLALGWLLAEGTLEKLVTRRVQQLDKTLFTQIPVHTQFSNELQVDSASLRKLQWLVGSLRHQGRILLSMQEERTRLLHAVFSASISSSVSSSEQSSAVLKESQIQFVFETAKKIRFLMHRALHCLFLYCLDAKCLAAKECACLRLLCELLESYLNWKQVETIFWTWMDSVMDGHLTHLDAGERPTRAPKERQRLCFHGNRGLEKLEDMLMRVQIGQKGQRKGTGDAEDGGETLQAGSDTSIHSLSSFPQVYRAKLQTERPVKHSRRAAERLDGAAEAPHELHASQAAQLLLQMEVLLLEQRDRLRFANRLQLQELVSRQDELVLIPP